MREVAARTANDWPICQECVDYMNGEHLKPGPDAEPVEVGHE